MKRLPLLLALTLLVALLFVASLAAGKVFVPFSAWFTQDPRWWIVAELRLPRAILGLVIGAGLGLTGAVLQGYLRNPLADPSVLGISSSAALGAVAAIVLLAASAPIAIFAAAMIAAAGSMLLLAALAWRSQSAVTFVLAGTVLASLGGALTAFLISIAPNPYATAEIIDWIMGSLTDRSFAEVRLAVPFILAGSVLLLFTGRALDALTLGEEAARSLGLRLERTQALVVLVPGWWSAPASRSPAWSGSSG
jgi:iron complex transport system permease protein